MFVSYVKRRGPSGLGRVGARKRRDRSTCWLRCGAVGRVAQDGFVFMAGGDGEPLEGRVSLEIDAGCVRYRVCRTDGRGPAEVVETRSLQVAHHLREQDRALRAVQYRLRPATPDPKPKDRQRKRVRREPVVEPE